MSVKGYKKNIGVLLLRIISHQIFPMQLHTHLIFQAIIIIRNCVGMGECRKDFFRKYLSPCVIMSEKCYSFQEIIIKIIIASIRVSEETYHKLYDLHLTHRLFRFQLMVKWRFHCIENMNLHSWNVLLCKLKQWVVILMQIFTQSVQVKFSFWCYVWCN